MAFLFSSGRFWSRLRLSVAGLGRHDGLPQDALATDATTNPEMAIVSQHRDYMIPGEEVAPRPAPGQPAADGGGGPEFIVDLARAEVVAGNEAARRLFLGAASSAAAGEGASVSGRFSHALDRSMPALARLTAIAGGAETYARLVLWTANGATPVDALCTPVTSPLGDACVRVAVQSAGAIANGAGAHDVAPAGDRRQRLNGAPASGGGPPVRTAGFDDASTHGAEAWRAPALAAPPDDAATLADIARRIRDGLPQQAGTAGDGGPQSRAPRAPAKPSNGDTPSSAPPASPQPANAQPGWTDLKLAKLAHELRTPLSAVVALAEIMRDERLGPMGSARYRGYAADIYESTQHALALIQSVVDEVRGEPVAAKPLSPFDTNRVIAASVSALDPFADRAGVTLVAALCPRLPVPAVEPRQLTQVMFNVLTNAFNHTPRGGRITVSAEARGGDGWLALVIEDTGRGMSAAEIAQVMARPVSAARPGSSPSGSTGFGVPIVREIVLAAGGTVEITSDAGRGARVAIALPPLRSYE